MITTYLDILACGNTLNQVLAVVVFEQKDVRASSLRFMEHGLSTEGPVPLF
jgi:hypothetical protein